MKELINFLPEIDQIIVLNIYKDLLFERTKDAINKICAYKKMPNNTKNVLINIAISCDSLDVFKSLTKNIDPLEFKNFKNIHISELLKLNKAVKINNYLYPTHNDCKAEKSLNSCTSSDLNEPQDLATLGDLSSDD